MELRACYFCGSPGGLDTYPVVPESITSRDGSDDPAEVVLCPDCHAKLERVLDGVLGAVDADVPPAADAGPAPDADASSADSAGISEITFDEADASRGSDPAGEAGADDGDEGGDDGTEGTDADAAGIDVVPGSSTGAADAPGDAESSAGPTEEAASTGEDGPTDADDDGSASGSSGGLRGLGNSGAGQYRQALRLLRNRDFPMSRSDVIDVMSSAYDLSREECDRLVDLAVERGSLTDDGGVLRQN